MSLIACVLQCVLQFVAVCCIVLHREWSWPCRCFVCVLQCVLQCVAVCCSVLQCVAVCCSVLQCGLQCVTS